MPTPFIYNRKIDQLEEKKAKVYTQKDSPYKGVLVKQNCNTFPKNQAIRFCQGVILITNCSIDKADR